MCARRRQLHECRDARAGRSRNVEKPSRKTRVVNVTFLGRPVAWLLTLLITVPFTAPFSTCDLSALLGAGNDASLMWTSPDAAGASIEAATASMLEEKRVKDGALAVVVIAAPISNRSEAAAPPVMCDTAPCSTLVALRL
jgi:hypothetical protein